MEGKYNRVKHFDEHTLELLVLGDPRAKKHEKQIAGHIAECAGCRSIFEEIRQYYVDVERERAKSISSPPLSAQRSLIRSRNELEPYFNSPYAEVVSYTEVKAPTLWRRVGDYGRNHPVASSFFAVAFLAIVGSLLMFVRTYKGQPGYYYYNTKLNRLEIYSSSNHYLWSLPAFDIQEDEKFENEHNAHETVITDLKGDGRKEIITAVPLRGDSNSRRLRVYDANGDLKKTFSFTDKEITFRGERYYTSFVPVFVISERMPGGSSNLFVYSDNGRSPAFLERLDANLNVIGKYWHYGDFAPYSIGPLHNGAREIMITGIDDIDEMSGRKFEFVAMLDPARIVGEKESRETPGFGFEPSDAELYYIKLPKSSLEAAEAVGGTPRMLKESTDSLIQIQVESGRDNTLPGYWGFDFIFLTDDMVVRDVKYTEPTPLTFEALKKQGKVHGSFDESYLEDLKKGVRYWDGREWVKTPTKIEHSEIAVN